MAELETEVSTPVEQSQEDTSTTVEPEVADTSTVEPEATNETVLFLYIQHYLLI